MSTTGVSRQLGVNVAIVLEYGTVNQSTIKGLNKLTLPSLSRAKVISEEFGIDFAVTDTGGGTHGDIKYSGNLVFTDTKGQTQLKNYLINNSKFTNSRIYSDSKIGDFLAVDLAKDTNTAFSVVDHTPGEVQKNGTFPFSGSWSVGGLYAYFTVHRPDVASNKIAFVATISPTTVGATITDSKSQFIANGFEAGQTLIIEGSTSNNGTYLIKTVAAGTITLDIAGAVSQLTSEASPGVACVLHGGTL
jgi:hypothetical protein